MASIEVFINTVYLSLVGTLLGTFVMKYFVRQVPLLRHAIIMFLAIVRGLLVAVFVLLLAPVLGVPSETLSSIAMLLGMCTTGWLITDNLAKDYGTSRKFPAVGAKVIFSFLVLLCVVIGVVHWLPHIFS